MITDCRGHVEAELVHTLAGLGFKLERHFTLPPPERGGRQRAEVISRAIECVRGSEVEEIVVGADLKRWTELRGLITKLRILPFPVNLIPVERPRRFSINPPSVLETRSVFRYSAGRSPHLSTQRNGASTS